MGALLLSGFASLVFQIVWVRRFAVVLGTTHLAITVVLAMFLGGLGLGALLAGRSGGSLGAGRLARRFLLLEAGTAACALALPFYLEATPPLLRAVSAATGAPGWTLAANALLAAGFLFPAATLMGATLPTVTALARRASSGGEGSGEGRAAGRLYAANTAGALLGSVAAARFLVPGLGLAATTLCAAGANLLAGSAVFARFRSRGAAEEAPAAFPARRRPMGGRRFAAVAALSGFAALASEVGWARLASLLFGPTTYTFACVVGAVILGVAAGSAAGTRLLRAGRDPGAWLAAVQVFAAAASAGAAWIGSRAVLPVGGLIARHAGDPSRLLDLQVLAAALVLLLPAAAMGASFPLAVAGAAGGGAPGRATGRIYGWTAAGNVAGALVAGLVVVPWLGLEAALLTAMGAHLAAALTARPASRALLAVAAAAGIAVFSVRSWDWEALSGGLYKAAPQLDASRHRDFLRRGRLVFLEQGAAATVSVKEIAGERSLAIDGKVDATDGADMLTQKMLAHLPLLLAPEPRSVLIVGHGSGVTAGSALRHPVRRVTALEISPEVAEASRLFAAANGFPWEDDRFELVETDARNHLMLEDRAFDVVISEPSNPWMSGVSPLFTVEFFELVRSRLSEGGLFCQWIHLYNLSEESLRTVVGSFTDVFQEAALFALHDGDALLLGARGRMEVASRAEIGARIAALDGELDAWGIRDAEAFRGLLTAGTPVLSTWAAGAARHTDDRPVLEFEAPMSMHALTAAANRRALEAVGTGTMAGVFGPPPPPDPARLTARAEGLLLAASPDWAFELAERALALDRGFREAAETLVRAAIRSGRAEPGEEALLRALAASSPPDAVGLAVERARLLHAAGAAEGAIAVLESGPGELRQDRDALLLAAEIQIGRGELDSAEALILAALAADPLDAVAAAWLAEISLRRGDPELAASRAAAILGERPDTVRALRIRAVALAEAGEVTRARAAFEELLERSPEPAIHWANAAAFAAAQGDSPEAVRLYREAVDRDPDNLTAYRGLEAAATRAGDREAQRRAREVLRGADSAGRR